MSGNIAIAYTVRDEARLLRTAVEYHIAIGCSRVYVFWDSTSDDAALQIAHIPQVVARPSVRPEELEDPPAWVLSIADRWATDMDVRKRINTFYAARMAFKARIEWLLAIDPDELVFCDKYPLGANHLPQLVAEAGPADQILLKNLEAVATSVKVQDTFVDTRIFLNRAPRTDWLWRKLRRLLTTLVRSRRFVAWYDLAFYTLRYGSALPRILRHPSTNKIIPNGWYLGYLSSKAALRTSQAEYCCCTIHKWVDAQNSLNNAYVGTVLHYDMVDLDALVSKFNQRYDSSMRLPHAREFLAEIAQNTRGKSLEDFFVRSIVVEPRKLKRLLERGLAVRIEGPAEFIARRFGRKEERPSLLAHRLHTRESRRGETG